MKKILTVLLCLFYPILALADGTTALFTPPTTDYSVIFLGNIFGIVDNVLHGTGSQLMGKMFAVFNSGVLALGGIMVTYILIVGTMNTSQEGQFLGQKWSGIWIPMRGVIGLSLIMPKASGYCLMQVFIMWITLQGIGAADSVWNAALAYLNAGGVFVGAQSNINPTTSDAKAVENIATGESAMLQGQVCMSGIQTALENARAAYLDEADTGGPCYKNGSGATMQSFCSTSVPDFLATFSAVQASTLGKTQVLMPNFNTGTAYDQLNGICGTIKWAALDMASETSDLDYISAQDVTALNQSRAIAIDQMYVELMPIAIAMVNNDPELNPSTNTDVSKRYSTIAQDQYGVTYLTDTGATCSGPSSTCSGWRATSTGATSTMIFSGPEFIYALNDYNAIMTPTLKVMADNDSAEVNNDAHAFVSHAKEVGWIMAGSFFFDLVRLNGKAAGGQTLIDTTSGLEGSVAFSASTLADPFNPGCQGTYSPLCTFLYKDSKPAMAVSNLITGASVASGLTPNVSSSSHAALDSIGSASTYGYINNASLYQVPGQPGLVTPTFKLSVNITPMNYNFPLPKIGFGCGNVFGFCIGRDIASFLYDQIFKNLVSFYLNTLTAMFTLVVETALIVPLTAIMTILNNGIQNLNTSQYHPIIGLAYMGTSFINYITDLYFQLLGLSLILNVIGWVIAVFVMPFTGAWMGIMFLIGFMDAYYVPFLPYMIFSFGALGWMIAVMEAMVAGPIAAFGVMIPEGHDAFGKAEQGMMITLNVFLRPSMMILGFIGGISLSYVGVYMLNSGFQEIMSFFYPNGASWSTQTADAYSGSSKHYNSDTPYTDFAALYASFFCMLTYTTIYVTMVEKSFSLIHLFPDSATRFIGGQAESHGKESAQWADSVKQQITEGAKDTLKASIEVSEGSAQKLGSTMGVQAGGAKGKMK